MITRSGKVAGRLSMLAIAAAMSGCGPRVDIRVMQATYGPNCGAPKGNATVAVAQACDGKKACSYRVHVHELGDPAPGCAKTFEVLYRCTGEENVRRLEVPAEAGLGALASPSCQA
jgi:hypothetical protein